MTLPALLLLAFGVSADAFAVALTQGLQLRRRVLRNALLIAVSFAVFQVAMPLIGWSVGTLFAGYITAVDHWVAFALLAVLGGKMLWGAVRGSAEEAAPRLDLRRLLVLSFATSVDALAVGISFAFLEVDVWAAVALVGVTTLVLSLAAVLIGQRVGARFRRPAELAGGVVLVFIGLQVLLEHLGVW